MNPMPDIIYSALIRFKFRGVSGATGGTGEHHLDLGSMSLEPEDHAGDCSQGDEGLDPVDPVQWVEEERERQVCRQRAPLTNLITCVPDRSPIVLASAVDGINDIRLERHMFGFSECSYEVV
jgi:hypothetical protein